MLNVIDVARFCENTILMFRHVSISKIVELPSVGKDSEAVYYHDPHKGSQFEHFGLSN